MRQGRERAPARERSAPRDGRSRAVLYSPRHMRLLARTLTLAVLVTMAWASTASATTPRFATPTGTGTACTAMVPCDVNSAINGSVANPTAEDDEVILGPGPYDSPMPLITSLSDNGRKLNIHGVAGLPRPVIHSEAIYGLHLTRTASTLSHVEIDYSGVDVGLQLAGVARDIVVKTVRAGSRACVVFGTLSDSLCLATGAGADAVQCRLGSAGPVVVLVAPVLRGVTAVATGTGGHGILASANDFVDIELAATNTIARGALYDVRAESVAPTGTAAVTLDHSDYASTSTSTTNATITAAGSAANRTEAPLFVNPTAGDYHVQANSPTIDTGAADPAGDTDLDGRPRTLGPAPDMGAFELPEAPSVSEGPPTSVSATGASFAATVNPQGLTSTVAFVYTPSGGAPVTSASVALGAGRSPVGAHVAVIGLAPHTAYSVRAVATNGAGSTSSLPLSFTTLTPRFAGVTIVTKRARLHKGKASISIACPAGIVGPCKVTLTLTASKRLGTAGKGKLTIAAGAKRTVKVRISRKVRERLRGGGPLTVSLKAAAVDGAGQTKTTRRKLKLRA